MTICEGLSRGAMRVNTAVVSRALCHMSMGEPGGSSGHLARVATLDVFGVDFDLWGDLRVTYDNSEILRQLIR